MEGWNFFYKLCVKILVYLREDIQELNDCGDIYIALKLGKNDDSVKEKEYIQIWETIISSAFNFDEMKY
jgi:hypothetical protein